MNINRLQNLLEEIGKERDALQADDARLEGDLKGMLADGPPATKKAEADYNAVFDRRLATLDMATDLDRMYSMLLNRLERCKDQDTAPEPDPEPTAVGSPGHTNHS